MARVFVCLYNARVAEVGARGVILGVDEECAGAGWTKEGIERGFGCVTSGVEGVWYLVQDIAESMVAKDAGQDTHVTDTLMLGERGVEIGNGNKIGGVAVETASDRINAEAHSVH